MRLPVEARRDAGVAAALALREQITVAQPAGGHQQGLLSGRLCRFDVAVWVTQEGQPLHGGWGYGEEFAISRYVVDAQVLPIFEGVKPILELKVIARTLLGA